MPRRNADHNLVTPAQRLGHKAEAAAADDAAARPPVLVGPRPMENHHVTHFKLASGRRLPLALFVLAAIALAAVGLSRSASAPAATNPNNYDCRGGIEKGAADADTGETEVRYIFACNGPITGFQVQPQIEATGYDTEVFGEDAVTKQVDGANDAFSCNGDIPGYGINCVGKYKGGYDRIEGKFTIDGDICAEPRVDPLLTVTYATANASGVVTQAIAGPFDLGRPRRSGCPATKFSGKTRIPRETSEDAADSDIG